MYNESSFSQLHNGVRIIFEIGLYDGESNGWITNSKYGPESEERKWTLHQGQKFIRLAHCYEHQRYIQCQQKQGGKSTSWWERSYSISTHRFNQSRTHLLVSSMFWQKELQERFQLYGSDFQQHGKHLFPIGLSFDNVRSDSHQKYTTCQTDPNPISSLQQQTSLHPNSDRRYWVLWNKGWKCKNRWDSLLPTCIDSNILGPSPS